MLESVLSSHPRRPRLSSMVTFGTCGGVLMTALEAANVTRSGSIGIALHDPASRQSADALLARADHAMYKSEHGGKNRYRTAALAAA